jgi:hypothetical protein
MMKKKKKKGAIMVWLRLVNSDFEQLLAQSLAAQLQVHPSATWWESRGALFEC